MVLSKALNGCLKILPWLSISLKIKFKDLRLAYEGRSLQPHPCHSPFARTPHTVLPPSVRRQALRMPCPLGNSQHTHVPTGLTSLPCLGLTAMGFPAAGAWGPLRQVTGPPPMFPPNPVLNTAITVVTLTFPGYLTIFTNRCEDLENRDSVFLGPISQGLTQYLTPAIPQ